MGGLLTKNNETTSVESASLIDHFARERQTNRALHKFCSAIAHSRFVFGFQHCEILEHTATATALLSADEKNYATTSAA
jgi:hypothetical protein